jgi:Zn-finger nucleic acid-binding protein
MANCKNCSAPVPADTIVCTYCGTRNDADLSGIHEFTEVVPDHVRTCPRCDIAMKTIDLKVGGTFLIERCDTCMGMFFDSGELEALIKATVKNVHHVNHNKLKELYALKRHDAYGITYIKCPVCDTIMNRVNFGQRSGVILDRCANHGLWLDGGELRHLLEWVKAGGKMYNQQREEIKQKMEAREGITVKRATTVHAGGGFDTYGSTLRSSDPDLFTIIGRVVKWMVG